MMSLGKIERNGRKEKITVKINFLNKFSIDYFDHSPLVMLYKFLLFSVPKIRHGRRDINFYLLHLLLLLIAANTINELEYSFVNLITQIMHLRNTFSFYIKGI